jgi:hypothetical protein
MQRRRHRSLAAAASLDITSPTCHSQSSFNVSPNTTSDTSHKASTMDFPSSPSHADESKLQELVYHVYDFDENMSPSPDHVMSGPSITTNNSVSLVPSAESSAPSEPRYWKPSLDASPGREGESPYLDLDNFDRAEDLLYPYNDQLDGETLFHSLQESVHWRSQQVVDNPPEYDETIPRDQFRKQVLVKTLFKAFKSTAIATDNPGMKKPFEEERHDNARVECLCWMLLEALIRRSEYGPLLVAYDPTKTKENPAIQTFAVRFDEVVQSLREQKTICKHLLDAPYINTFVDDPVRARNRVASNRDLNRKKGETMNVGREELRKGSQRATTRTKGKKRARSTPTDGDFSDEPSAEYSPSPATLHGASGRSVFRPCSGSMTSTRHSSRYTPTSMQSSYGGSRLYTDSPVGFQVSTQPAPITYPTTPTPGRSLTLQNTQSSSSQSVAQSPATTPLQLPQSMLGNYHDVMSQTVPNEWMFPNQSMSHLSLIGVGEQVSNIIKKDPRFARLLIRIFPVPFHTANCSNLKCTFQSHLCTPPDIPKFSSNEEHQLHVYMRVSHFIERRMRHYSETNNLLGSFTT